MQTMTRLALAAALAAFASHPATAAPARTVRIHNSSGHAAKLYLRFGARCTGSEDARGNLCGAKVIKNDEVVTFDATGAQQTPWLSIFLPECSASSSPGLGWKLPAGSQEVTIRLASSDKCGAYVTSPGSPRNRSIQPSNAGQEPTAIH